MSSTALASIGATYGMTGRCMRGQPLELGRHDLVELHLGDVGGHEGDALLAGPVGVSDLVAVTALVRDRAQRQELRWGLRALRIPCILGFQVGDYLDLRHDGLRP